MESTHAARVALGKEIKKARIDLEKAQQVVAQRAAISSGYLSQIEGGREASADVLRRIAIGIELRLSELLDRAAKSSGNSRLAALAKVARLLEEIESVERSEEAEVSAGNRGAPRSSAGSRSKKGVRLQA